jgi:hypothetical protein
MNAFDSRSEGHSARPLSDPTLTLLRQAVAGRLRDPAGPDGELREALRAVAAEARARELRPEELVIALKTLFDETAARLPGPRAEERSRLRESIVAACIRAYFAPPEA